MVEYSKIFEKNLLHAIFEFLIYLFKNSHEELCLKGKTLLFHLRVHLYMVRKLRLIFFF